MEVWRLQTNTDSVDGLKIADICLRDKILALGWSLKDSHLPKESKDEIIYARGKIKTFEDYEKVIKDYKVYSGRGIGSVYRLYYNVKIGDLVWMRKDGIYYLGRVEEGSQWRYCSQQSALDKDASNQRTNVAWIAVGDESAVPGAVATSLIRGSTLQRVLKDGVKEFSQLLYNKLFGKDVYKEIRLKTSEHTFYSLLSTDDCEDLLCLWLYEKYGYIVIPSTNKKATELYECVLRNPKNGASIYVQVKINTVINAAEYRHLPGVVYLFSTSNNIANKDSIGSNINIIDSKILYEFAMADTSKNILSTSIVHWVEFLKNPKV